MTVLKGPLAVKQSKALNKNLQKNERLHIRKSGIVEVEKYV